MKLAEEARGTTEQMDAYRETQDQLREAMKRIDREVQGPVERLAARVYADGTPIDAHNRRLKDRVQQCVELPPPVHPCGELEQKANLQDHYKFERIINKEDR